MNPNINELCKDPLFQLNLAIWLTQPQPSEFFCVYPIFYESGLKIYSIGPLLALPADIRLTVSGKVDCRDGVRPDLVLETKELKKYCILECKASSFGPDSSTAQQARTLLLVTGPILSEVLGLGTRGQNGGLLCYLIGPNQTEMLETTLETLEKEIRERVNLESGNFGCFRVKPTESTVTLEYHEDIKKFLNLAKDSPIEVVKFEKTTDPRPLYFIPYDPNIQQTKEEQQFCRRILFERILSYIISNIGGATIPTTITSTTEDLLNAATFGVYEIWEDNEATKNVRRLVKDFLISIKNSINEPLRECITYESNKGWIFNLKDKETHEGLLKEFQKFKPETLDLSKQTQPDLFETMEDYKNA